MVTQNTTVIKRWAEDRGATPATTEPAPEDRPRVLAFDFPGYGGRNLKKITWDAWLKTFQDRKLNFIYQEQLRNGKQSNFFRIESPEREDA